MSSSLRVGVKVFGIIFDRSEIIKFRFFKNPFFESIQWAGCEGRNIWLPCNERNSCYTTTRETTDDLAEIYGDAARGIRIKPPRDSVEYHATALPPLERGRALRKYIILYAARPPS
jgi:hypothetical protein